MRKKLIKKAQEGTKAPGGTSTSTGGSGSDFAADKSSGYPNTGNTGASQQQGQYYGSTQRSQSTGGNSLTNGTGGKQGSGFTGGGGGSSEGGSGFWGAGGGWSMIGQGAEVLGSLIPKQPQAALTQGLNAGYDAVSNAIAAVPGFGTIASGAMKIGGLLADGLTALGVGTDGVTTMDQILDSKFMKLTPVGLMNAFGASRLAELRKDQAVRDTLDNTNGGYSGFMDKWEDAQKYSGKKVGLFSSKSSLNNKIFSANERMSRLQGVIGKKMEDDLLIAQMADRWNQRTMNDLNGGFGNIMFGRLGLKVETLAKVHEILNRPKVVDTLKEYEEVPEFKTGGKMNVIPEGSLHARLHHMENAEGLTKKGIPVVSISEGGDLEQQAEIELNEIIFNLEVTQELEKLMKDGTDNAAIEAGKLLVEEIFNNTDDRTGLIKDITEGSKKEETTEDIVKQHRAFQHGGPIPNTNNPNAPENIMDKLISEWPVLSQIKFNLVPDSTFTADKTGIGSIEYFSPNEADEMTYPNGYKYKNPHKGEASIVYNPAVNEYEDIKMDLLHALRDQDYKYKELIKVLDDAVLNGDDDLKLNARKRYNEDFKKLGKEYMPLENYVKNEVDGLLRNLFYNGSPEVLYKKRYYPNKEELKQWNKHLLPYIEKIQNYLSGK